LREETIKNEEQRSAREEFNAGGFQGFSIARWEDILE
jgi:hypothetical protein